MRVRFLLYRLGLLFLLSYGFLYFSYKWLDPTQVNTDFIEYYGMIQHPLDLHVAPSPWCFRQLTTLIASAFWRLHVYYPDAIQFHNSHYDQRIFFAMLLTNYLGIILAALGAMMISDEILAERGIQSQIVPLVAGMLCFFDFFFQETTLAGQADGLSWAIMAFGYYFYRKRKLAPFALAMVLTIVQREIMPLIFLIFALIDAWRARSRGSLRERRFLRSALLVCCGVFASYLAWKHFTHIPGNEYQTDIDAQQYAILHFRPNKAYILQVFIGQNLLFVLSFLWALVYLRYREISRNTLSLYASCFVLVLISIMANISNNAGRMLALLTPIVAAEITLALVRLDDSTHAPGAEMTPTP